MKFNRKLTCMVVILAVLLSAFSIMASAYDTTTHDHEHSHELNVVEIMVGDRLVGFVVSDEEYEFYQEHGVFEYELAAMQQVSPITVRTCSHTSQTPAWPEAAHPHYFYNRCQDCSALINTGKTGTLAGCQDCCDHYMTAGSAPYCVICGKQVYFW